MIDFDDEEYENYLEEQIASEELKEIYDVLSKKLNAKTKNELEYLRKRNAVLEEEVKEQSKKLYKYQCESYDIRRELEAEYKEKERNLYKRPIDEIVGLLNQEYFKIRVNPIYADCSYCNNTRKYVFVDPFGKEHSWACECQNTVIKLEYYAQSEFVGVIKELSLRDNKIRCFVDFRKEAYSDSSYISGTYLDPENIIKTKEDLTKVYEAIKEADFRDRFETDSKASRYYSVCSFLFTTKELAEEVVNYLNKEE